MSNSRPTRSGAGWMILLICAAAVLTFWLRSGSRPGASQGTGAGVDSTNNAPPIYRLAGRWLRTDGDYTLDLENPLSDGKLTARYFNPQPINVGRAEWTREGKELRVMIELRDVNYPGSTYKLVLDGEHRLRGTYYQATMGETYEIEFLRQP